jgi:hypothetical protein
MMGAGSLVPSAAAKRRSSARESLLVSDPNLILAAAGHERETFAQKAEENKIGGSPNTRRQSVRFSEAGMPPTSSSPNGNKHPTRQSVRRESRR